MLIFVPRNKNTSYMIILEIVIYVLLGVSFIILAFALVVAPLMLIVSFFKSVYDSLKGRVSDGHHTPGIVWFDALF